MLWKRRLRLPRARPPRRRLRGPRPPGGGPRRRAAFRPFSWSLNQPRAPRARRRRVGVAARAELRGSGGGRSSRSRSVVASRRSTGRSGFVSATALATRSRSPSHPGSSAVIAPSASCPDDARPPRGAVVNSSADPPSPARGPEFGYDSRPSPCPPPHLLRGPSPITAAMRVRRPRRKSPSFSGCQVMWLYWRVSKWTSSMTSFRQQNTTGMS